MEELSFHGKPPLMIAYTPLHVLIIERLLSAKSIDEFDLIYFSNTDSPKHKEYYKRLESRARTSLFLPYRRRSVLNSIFLIGCLGTTRLLRGTPGRAIFVASLKQIPTRLVLQLTRSFSLYTFDDGWGNVSGRGYYYDDDKGILGLLTKSMWRGFGYRTLVSRIERHFTIFRDLENVYAGVGGIEFVELFPRKDLRIPAGDHNQRIAVLLTAPFSENGILSEIMEREFYLSAIRKFRIDLVITHPGERYSKLDNGVVAIANEEQIAEDVIGDILRRGNSVDLYGFSSTTLLILAKTVENLVCHSIKVPEIDVDEEIFGKVGVNICQL